MSLPPAAAPARGQTPDDATWHSLATAEALDRLGAAPGDALPI